jgi:hypothetical protein
MSRSYLDPLRRGIALGVLGFSLIAGAEDPAPTPRTPDLLGIYPGMSNLEARAQLQKHSSTVFVQTNSSQARLGFGMTIPDPRNRDQVSVYLTHPPNEPTVWMIQRAQTFDPGVSMLKDNLLAALRQKYGTESLYSDHGGGGLYYYWVFDKEGHRLASADPRYMNCSGNDFVANISRGPEKLNEELGLCYGSFLGLTLYINMWDAQMVRAYSVELVNLPYAVEAATLTMTAKSAADQAARAAEIEKSNQNKPSF